MRPSPALVPIVLALVALGLGIFVWSLQRQLTDTAELLAATPVKTAARFAVADQLRGPSVPMTADASKQHATEPPTRPQETASTLDDPLTQQHLAYIRNGTIIARYAVLFKKLGLAPAELEKLKTLLGEKLSASMDVFLSARTAGLDTRASDGEIQKLVAELRAETDREIHALLSDSGFQEYQRYEQTQTQRNLVNQIQRRLSYSSAPLDGDQAEKLVSLLAEHGSIEAPPAERAYEGPRATLTAAFIAQSQGFLSTEQIEAIREFYQEKAELNQLSQQVAQASSRRP